MEYANFHGAEIYGGNEVDFSGSDLHDAYFEDAAFLAGDVIFFDGADLSKSDFDGSVFEVYNYGEINYDFNYYFEGVDFYCERSSSESPRALPPRHLALEAAHAARCALPLAGRDPPTPCAPANAPRSLLLRLVRHLLLLS